MSVLAYKLKSRGDEFKRPARQFENGMDVPRTLAEVQSPVEEVMGVDYQVQLVLKLELELPAIVEAKVEPEAGGVSLWIRSFNEKLVPLKDHPRILRITSLDQFHQLSEFHFLSPLPQPETMFPYLHGLSGARQRLFYRENFKLADGKPDFELLAKDVVLPVLEEHLFLMFLDTRENGRRLVNLCSVEDILVPQHKPVDKMNLRETIEYEHLSLVNRLSYMTEDLDSRNYRLQTKLMAPLCHFVVYNNDMNFQTNEIAAKRLESVSDNKFIYIVDVDAKAWNNMDCSLFCRGQNELYKMEQKMVHQLNSMKNPFPNVITGTTTDSQEMAPPPHGNFDLVVRCHEKAGFPSLDVLNNILTTDKYDKPITLEFPSSSSFDSTKITFNETLSMLNTLKLFHRCVKCHGKRAFVYSKDGFTGISVLILALGCLWETGTKVGFIEEVISKLGSTDSNFRFYYFKEDLVFLKKLERFVNWVRLSKLNDPSLIAHLEYEDINANYNKLVLEMPSPSYDWFNFSLDNNFPSEILRHLYLGTLCHSSSFTILNHLKVNKIISMGECPFWFKKLGVLLEHEVNGDLDTDTKPIIKPSYTFKGGLAKVYHIDNIDLEECPHLKLLVYIHNLKDDGKDSLLPLLVDCPSHVQDQFLTHCPSKSTLIHCRIGVSRSATIAIAMLMKHKHMSLIDAYMFVRVRRFNMIIQPNLRFFYELFCFEEYLNGGARSKCWWTLCQEIAQLNEVYLK